MQTSRTGNFLAALSFLVWGLLPLYYHQLPQADVNELLALRIIFSIPCMLLFMGLLRRPLPPIATILADKRSLIICCLASLLMCVSWYSFIWATTHGEVLAASLGFFINPLISIALGVLFLKEQLSSLQRLAVALAIAGIGYQVYHYGQFPWLSLCMGSFFALYSLCKKHIRYDALTSVTIEAAVLLPFALIFMVWQYVSQQSVALSSGLSTFLFYVGAAPATLVPLIIFALAISRTSLSMVGLMQYIEPSLQFILAVYVFGELFDSVKMISFSLIWIGLLLCSLEAIARPLRRRLRPI
ncbi:RarD protein [Sinobacterium caligoides]|uniref:RarD protein n=1 Tax=Sinobacterium caligoides TaxID=933926 RepID=A0A3N2E032_9GAMM|nr:EamA family transporter RarD [Sinobacterium caligoides]ROS05461.1 RarD protein [Sinobacterium caligoides]